MKKINVLIVLCALCIQFVSASTTDTLKVGDTISVQKNIKYIPQGCLVECKVIKDGNNYKLIVLEYVIADTVKAGDTISQQKNIRYILPDYWYMGYHKDYEGYRFTIYLDEKKQPKSKWLKAPSYKPEHKYFRPSKKTICISIQLVLLVIALVIILKQRKKIKKLKKYGNKL